MLERKNNTMLNTLQKVTTKKQKRLGRGHGSGKVKTSGRGTKGTKARGSVPIFFEGGGLPLIKRLPVLRGKARNKSFIAKPIEVDLKDLEIFAKGTVVDVKALVANKIIDKKMEKNGVKILSNGEISKALKIKVSTTKGAREKIEKAGGEILTGI